jgi:hypothetical protein
MEYYDCAISLLNDVQNFESYMKNIKANYMPVFMEMTGTGGGGAYYHLRCFSIHQ